MRTMMRPVLLVVAVAAAAFLASTTAVVATVPSTTSVPFSKRATGELKNNEYKEAHLGTYASPTRAATVALRSTPPQCLRLCLTDVAPAIDDTAGWECLVDVTDTQSAANGPLPFFCRPGNVHVNLFKYNATVAKCAYEVTVEGSACESMALFGPACEPRQAPALNHLITLDAGDTVVYQALTRSLDGLNPQRIVMGISVSGQGGGAVDVYARAYDHPRPDAGVYDVKSTVAPLSSEVIDVNVTVALPPKGRLAGSNEAIPIFFMVDNTATTPVNAIITTVEQATCDMPWAGTHCRDTIVTSLQDKGVYNLTMAHLVNGTVRTLLAIPPKKNEEFSVGVLATSGWVRLMLRFGNAGSSSLHDVAMTPANASDPTTENGSVSFYATGKKGIDVTSGQWLIEIEGSPSAAFLLWFNSKCPADCSDNGKCDGNSHQCACKDSYPPPLCTTELVQPGIPMDDSAQGGSHMSPLDIFAIVVAAFVIVSILVYVITVLYTRYRRAGYELMSDAASDYHHEPPVMVDENMAIGINHDDQNGHSTAPVNSAQAAAYGATFASWPDEPTIVDWDNNSIDPERRTTDVALVPLHRDVIMSD